MDEQRKQLTNISEEDVEKLRRKTAYSLPDSPARAGMRAGAVKPRFYEALTEGDVSLIAYLRRVILEVNEALAWIHVLMSADAQDLAAHEEDAEAHKALFDAAGASLAAHKAEIKALLDDANAELAAHEGDAEAHKELFTKKADADKGVIDDIIGEASENQRGLMSAEQFVQLATLVALLENDDVDVTINTIKEVLKAFEGYDNGTLIANLLAEKLDKSHTTSLSAHSALFAKKLGTDHNTSVSAHSALFNSKISKFSDTQVLYANNSAGDLRALKYTAALLGSTVPYRNSSNHTFRIGDPIDNDHPVTLGYFKNKVVSMIPTATSSRNGLMTKAQVSKLDKLAKLEQLVAFLEGPEEENGKLDTIAELLSVFSKYPDGTDIMTLFSGKVDKTEGDGVYATDEGDEVKLEVAVAAEADALARRNERGGVTVPVTPTAGGDAASKQYVDVLWNALTFGEWGA